MSTHAYVVNLLSSPGAGKTTLVEETLRRLKKTFRVAALAGDRDADEVDLLIIENAGNLMCPAEYDVCEDLRVVLSSVAEGEDKPLSYPLAFGAADLVLLTKIDLAFETNYDEALARRNIERVNSGVRAFSLSTHTGEGFDRWLETLEGAVANRRRVPSPV